MPFLVIEDFLELYENGLISSEDLHAVFQQFLEGEALRNVPRRLSVEYGRFSLENMTDDDVVRLFRFRKVDLPVLATLLEFPISVRTETGYRVPGVTALCILLRRLAYPNRLADLERIFGMSSSTISAIAIWVTSFITERKGHLLTDLRNRPWLAEKLPAYSEAVARRGAPLTNCWAFIDGTARKICRPTQDQNLYYSGHKRFHCLKYQSILTPDGIIVNLQGPFQGRRHDAGIWTGCRVQDQVRRLCITPLQTFVLYGDPAYPVSDILIAPYPSTNREPHAVAFNRAMSSVRQAVEWGFGKVVQQFAFVDFSKNQKLQLQDLGGMYGVAVLLANCHTCLYGSQSSEYFAIDPPTLQQYLTE